MNIEQIRKDTLGCTDKIFLNSAGASLMPGTVIKSLTEYLYEEERLGGYKTEAIQKSAIDDFYHQTALLLNTKNENIAFAYNATDAYTKALQSIPFVEGDYILTTNDDYVSNQIAFLSLKDRFKINIVHVDNLENNDLDVDAFEQLIKKHRPKLIAVTHIPTSSGLIQDVEAIGTLCSQYDSWYLVDACQSVGQLPVDVQKIKCDFLSATGRKFLRGPRGTGFLYVSDKALQAGLVPLTPDMSGADWTAKNEFQINATAKRFELWEKSYASVVGLTEAIRYANELGLDNIARYNEQLCKRLRHLLSENEHITVLDKGTQLGSIITFNTKKLSLPLIEQHLQKNNIYYSVTYKKSALIDFTQKKADWAIRFSPHYFNTTEEIETVATIVKKYI